LRIFAKLFLQFGQRQIRLLLEPVAKPIANGLGKLGLAPRLVRDARHRAGAQLLASDFLHIPIADTETRGQLRLTSFALLQGFQNPAP